MKDELRVMWRYDEGLDLSHLDQWNTPLKYYDVCPMCEACGETMVYRLKHRFSCQDADCPRRGVLLTVGEELETGKNAGYMMDKGEMVPFEQYEQTWGDPNRYVGLLGVVQHRCTCCESWAETDVHIGDVNILDTDGYFLGDILQDEINDPVLGPRLGLEDWQRDLTLELFKTAEAELKEKDDGR